MLLGEIRQRFCKSLATLYPQEENLSLFEISAEHILLQNRTQIHNSLSKNTPPEAEKKMLSILERLKNHEPIQYILGIAYFYDLELMVRPGVLIPRQETEYLVHLIVKENQTRGGLSVIDLCTGSGCIAVALAKHIPGAHVTATDISSVALDIASENAAKHAVKIDFIQDDLLMSDHFHNKFDIIVCNPPYVRHLEKKFMHRNVLDYEPADALFVDDSDPLIFYRAVIRFAKKYASRQVKVYLEINEFLAAEMQNLFEMHQFSNIEIVKDLNNKSRYLRCNL